MTFEEMRDRVRIHREADAPADHRTIAPRESTRERPRETGRRHRDPQPAGRARRARAVGVDRRGHATKVPTGVCNGS
jgi:hypothetical protein